MGRTAIKPDVRKMQFFGGDLGEPDAKQAPVTSKTEEASSIRDHCRERLEAFRNALTDANALARLERERLSDGRGSTARMEKHAACEGALRNAFDRVREFMTHADFAVYRIAKPIDGIVYSVDALKDAQASVDAIRAELSRVEGAPLPASERKAALMAQIDMLASIGRPNLSPDGTAIQPIGANGILQFLAWLLPREMTEAKVNELVGPERDGAMSSAEKAERVTKLRNDLTTAEAMEVALIDASDGDAVYRPNTSVTALLRLER